MKKLLGLICIFALVIALVSGVTATASAAVANDVVFTMTETREGKEVTLQVNLVENDGIVSFGLRLEYDDSALEYVGREFGPALETIDADAQDAVSNGSYRLVGVGRVNNSTDTGRFLTLHFKEKKGAVNGTYDFDLFVTDVTYKDAYGVTESNPKYLTKGSAAENYQSGGVKVATASYAITDGAIPQTGDGSAVLVIVLVTVGAVVLVVGGIFLARYLAARKKKKNGKNDGAVAVRNKQANDSEQSNGNKTEN